MSSVLARASSILSLLGSDPRRAFTVAEVAASVELPSTSCQRLLADLVQLGWADQRGRRRGYRLGPRAYALTTAQPYRGRLMSRVRGPAAALAEELDRMVVVAALRGGRRQTLCCYVAGGLPMAERQLWESDDIYSTSGGRLLLALQPTVERQYIIGRLGLPTQRQWRGVLTPRELHDELAALRRERWCSIDRGRSITMSAAFRDGEGGWAAIGCFGPKRGWDRTVAQRVSAVAAALDLAD